MQNKLHGMLKKKKKKATNALHIGGVFVFVVVPWAHATWR
jgi:hypothetical protein